MFISPAEKIFFFVSFFFLFALYVMISLFPNASGFVSSRHPVVHKLKIKRSNGASVLLTRFSGKFHLSECWTHGKNFQSKGNWWPASSIKLLPALALMKFVEENRLNTTSQIYRMSKNGKWKSWGTVESLIYSSVAKSSNVAYDRTVLFLSQDYVNRFALSLGLKDTWISKAYASRNGFNQSPRFRYKTIDGFLVEKRAESSSLKSRSCKSNCTSITDLQIMIVESMHHFSIRRAMVQATSYTKATMKRLLGKDVKVYSKAGWVNGHHLIENIFINSPRHGKWILTITQPSQNNSLLQTKKSVSKIASKLATIIKKRR